MHSMHVAVHILAGATSLEMSALNTSHIPISDRSVHCDKKGRRDSAAGHVVSCFSGAGTAGTAWQDCRPLRLWLFSNSLIGFNCPSSLSTSLDHSRPAVQFMAQDTETCSTSSSHHGSPCMQMTAWRHSCVTGRGNISETNLPCQGNMLQVRHWVCHHACAHVSPTWCHRKQALGSWAQRGIMSAHHKQPCHRDTREPIQASRT